jgi:uncharacterized protein YkwD
MTFRPTDLEYELFNKINQVRQHPESLIPILEDRNSYFKGKVYYPPETPDLGQSTIEGPAGCREAIRFLKNQGGVEPLEFSFGLSKSAILHASDMNSSGLQGHKGSDGSGFQARVEHYGKWHGKIAENLKFGFKSALGILIELVIDDGVPARNNRNCIFGVDFRFIGLAHRDHPQWDCCTVIVFAERYLSDYD